MPTTGPVSQRHRFSGTVGSDAFRQAILAVIEHRSGELETVEGIGPKRRLMIKQAWNDGKQVCEIMLFLHGQFEMLSNIRDVIRL